jgi:hypothetical protein
VAPAPDAADPLPSSLDALRAYPSLQAAVAQLDSFFVSIERPLVVMFQVLEPSQPGSLSSPAVAMQFCLRLRSGGDPPRVAFFTGPEAAPVAARADAVVTAVAESLAAVLAGKIGKLPAKSRCRILTTKNRCWFFFTFQA